MKRINVLSGAIAVAVMLLAVVAVNSGDSVDTSIADTSIADTAPAPDPGAELDTVEAPATDEEPDQQTDSDSTVGDATQRFSDLPVITPAELPVEAIETLLLIADGGPYPYRQDDEVFQNREGLLPDRELGHYREYTVDTPGSDDRGARRIVSGADGELYYTDDHYDSFREIVP